MNLPPPAQPLGYLGVQEAAIFLATSRKGLYGLVARREIPFRRLGRRLLFNPSELKDWIERSRVAPLKELEPGSHR